MHINNLLQLNIFTNFDCPYKFVSGVRWSSLQICLVRVHWESQKISKIVIAEPALVLFCLRCSLSAVAKQSFCTKNAIGFGNTKVLEKVLQ